VRSSIAITDSPSAVPAPQVGVMLVTVGVTANFLPYTYSSDDHRQ